MLDNSIQATIYLYFTYYVPHEFKDLEECVAFAKRLYLGEHRNIFRMVEKYQFIRRGSHDKK